MILAFTVNDPLPDLPNFAEMDNLAQEHATEMKQGSYWSLEHVLSRPLHREPLLTILGFSVNDTLPDLLSLSWNGYLDLGPRHGE